MPLAPGRVHADSTATPSFIHVICNCAIFDAQAHQKHVMPRELGTDGVKSGERGEAQQRVFLARRGEDYVSVSRRTSASQRCAETITEAESPR